MFPAATAILPLFIRIRDLGLLDSYWGVVLPQVAFGLAMSILLFRNYFRQLPGDLFDAALVDGCGYIRFFWHIVAAAVAADPRHRRGDHLRAQLEQLPAAAGRAQPRELVSLAARHHGYQGEYSTDWQLVLAFITLTILPVIMMFFAAQRHIVAGLTMGSVKG